MERIIMIKYGELNTKGANIKTFINILEKNIKKLLSDYVISISKNRARMYIYYDISDESKIVEILKCVPGIYSIVICYRVDTNISSISNKSIEILRAINFKSFKVETNRAFKQFEYPSLEVSKMVGAEILKNIENINVDVRNPDTTVYIDIRDARDTYIYTNEIKCLGGYPVSSNGRGLLMLSGGIDSPVAGFLSLKKGLSIDCIYFESIPHTNLDARGKVIKLTNILNNYDGNINLYIVPFTKIQEEIIKNMDPSYVITIMRRMMYRISSKLANKLGAKVLINGESIGQVASQTLSSMSVIEKVIDIPVIRPISCMDKLEIIDIAKKIKTYDISILPFEDCCTIFVPTHPVINPNLEKCESLESNINYNNLVEECINNIMLIDLNFEKSKFNDLL